jgi:hypothetical protein
MISAAAVLGVVTSFGLRTRLPGALVATILAAVGGLLAWGGLLLLDGGRAELALAVPLMAVLVPAHIRIVLGRFGKR